MLRSHRELMGNRFRTKEFSTAEGLRGRTSIATLLTVETQCAKEPAPDTWEGTTLLETIRGLPDSKPDVVFSGNAPVRLQAPLPGVRKDLLCVAIRNG
jgi:hypothetical protein